MYETKWRVCDGERAGGGEKLRRGARTRARSPCVRDCSTRSSSSKIRAIRVRARSAKNAALPNWVTTTPLRRRHDQYRDSPFTAVTADLTAVSRPRRRTAALSAPQQIIISNSAARVAVQKHGSHSVTRRPSRYFDIAPRSSKPPPSCTLTVPWVYCTVVCRRTTVAKCLADLNDRNPVSLLCGGGARYSIRKSTAETMYRS